VAAAMARWRAFVRPADLFCVWGRYPLDLLRAEGGPERGIVDLRGFTTQRLDRRAGGIEQAARLLGGDGLPPPWTDGRAGRRIAALAHVLAVLADAPPAARECVA
jgi:DTW domain-containing protein